MQRLLHRFWRRRHTKFGLVVLIGLAIGCGAVASGMHATRHTPTTHPATTRTSPSSRHVANLKPATPPTPTKPQPTPTTAAPTPTTTAPASIPAPKPAADVSQSPAAVAETNTSPGTGVAGLSPTGGSPTPAAPATDISNATATPPATCTNAPARYGSTNWAGYLRTGCTFTAISGAWTVPTPTTTSTTDTTADAAWIGIGGVTTDDLIQVGTEETVDTDGTINAAVFYELLPDMPHYPTSVTVSPGDHVSAAISETSPNQWLITIANVTTGTSYSKTVTYTSSYSSAEWIEEDPSYADGSLVPFDNFGTVSFNGCSSTGNTITSNLSDASEITLTDQQGNALATPSAVTGVNSNTFSVVRRNS